LTAAALLTSVQKASPNQREGKRRKDDEHARWSFVSRSEPRTRE